MPDSLVDRSLLLKPAPAPVITTTTTTTTIITMVLSSVDQSNKVYLLPLADDGSPDVPGGYIYLPPPSDPPYTVRFLIEGTSSICREGSFWTNIPAENEEFVREKFREYK